jgi:hypothetical protein
LFDIGGAAMISLPRFIRAVKAALLKDEGKVFPVSVRRLELRDGDVVVLKFSVPLSVEAVIHIRDSWTQLFPNVKPVILGSSVDISVLAGVDITAARAGSVH